MTRASSRLGLAGRCRRPGALVALPGGPRAPDDGRSRGCEETHPAPARTRRGARGKPGGAPDGESRSAPPGDLRGDSCPRVPADSRPFPGSQAGDVLCPDPPAPAWGAGAVTPAQGLPAGCPGEHPRLAASPQRVGGEPHLEQTEGPAGTGGRSLPWTATHSSAQQHPPPAPPRRGHQAMEQEAFHVSERPGPCPRSLPSKGPQASLKSLGVCSWIRVFPRGPLLSLSLSTLSPRGRLTVSWPLNSERGPSCTAAVGHGRRNFPETEWLTF